MTVGPLLVPLRRENASARGAGTAGGSGLAAQARSGREWSRQPLSLGGIALWARPGLAGPTDSSSELAAGLARTETVGCFGLCGARTPMRWRVDCGTGDNAGGIQRGGHDDARGFRRRDRRTHDDVGGARSEGRRARGAARARLRRAGWEEPARWLAERQHGRDDAGGIRRGGHDDARGSPTARSAHARRCRRRAIGRTTRSRRCARPPSSSWLGGAGAVVGGAAARA